MQFSSQKIYKGLIILNGLISIIITLRIFYKNNYSFENINIGLIAVIIYASIWFFSLYKIYNFSKIGLKIYISLTIFTLTEHMIIGSIITFSYYSKIKHKFK